MNREQIAQILGFPPSDEQWAAIAAPLDSPLLVLAGAGSGKTAVMAARVLWLVGSGAVSADQVLGLTFTNKAAGELSERVRSLLARIGDRGDDPPEPTIATFHAFAIDLLAQYALLIGVEPSARLLSPTDLAVATYRTVVRTSLACEELGSSHMPTLRKYIQSLDEQMSEHLVSGEQLRRHDDLFIEMLAGHSGKVVGEMAQAAARRQLATRVVAEVRAAREAEGVVGFADLMRHVAALSQVPRVRAELRDRYRVVLVDEYQDTSVAQALLLHNLFGNGFPLTAVGDPLQAIYGWRGASVANIDGFPQTFGARTTTLSINRRSGSLILEVANAVAADVRAQHPGVLPLRPDTEGGEVTAALFESWADEVDWLAHRVAELIEAGSQPDRIAVLTRTNTYADQVVQKLREVGVPAAAATLGSLLELPEVVEVLSVMRVLQTGDNAALVRLLTGPAWRIGPSDLAVLGRRARNLAGGDDSTPEPEEFAQRLQRSVAETDPVDVVSLIEAVYDPGPAVSAEARERLAELTSQLDSLRSAMVAGVEDLAHRIVEVTGLGVEVRLGPNAATRVDGLSALFDLIADYRSGHADPSVDAFLIWLDRAAELDTEPDAEMPVRGQAVQVMTVHRAKGLEWDCVFVPALSKGVFPPSKGRPRWTTSYSQLPYPLRGDSSRLPVLPGWGAAGGDLPDSANKAHNEILEACRADERAEEDRLAYVALTRARDRLVVTGHWWSKDVKLKGPSPYLETVAEVPGVRVPVWVAEQPEKPVGLEPRDVEWPSTDPIWATSGGEEPGLLTAQEEAVLARMDADIEAVTQREYEQALPTRQVVLPPVLSTSMVMRAVGDPEGLALDLARPMPRITGRAAARGTAFHAWVAATHQQLALFPDWEAAMDSELVADHDLTELIAGYRRTPYAELVPVDTETEVAVSLAGMVVRGVIDAVFQHPDGTWEVVDWKTNQDHDADPVQLAIYRIGWAQKVGVPVDAVLASFVYVRDGDVVRPELPTPAELTAMLETYSENRAEAAQ